MKISNFKKIGTEKKISIAGFIIAAIIACIIIFVIIPGISGIKKIGEDIMQQRIDAENKYKKGQKLNKLAENLKIIEPQIEKLDQIFINQNDALKFITSLEETAEKNKVKQKINLLIAQKAPFNNYQKMPLQLFIEGNFIDELNYLLSLENLNYFVNIKLLEITAGEAKGGSADMLIFADTYWK